MPKHTQPEHTHHPLPTPHEIVRYLDTYVCGQEQAKRALAVAVHNHYLGLGYQDYHAIAEDMPRPHLGAVFGKQHILLMGPTGSGKTYLIRLIAELLGVPWVFAAATSLVQSGYVGTRIENVVGALYQKTGGNRLQAERGIILIDEVDKIAAHRGGSGPDVGGEGVQQALLSVLDGRVVQASTGGSSDHVMGEVDTSSILFVCAGAFVGLEEAARRRRGGQGIGFSVPPGAAMVAPGLSFHEDLPDTEDLVQYGFIPEFVGRFATISATRALTTDDLVSVLETAEESALPRQRRLFEVHGIDLEFTPGALRAVAEEARALGTGARGLNRMVLRSLADLDFRLPELAGQGVTGVTVTADVVHGRRAPSFRRARRRGRERKVITTVADDLRRIALTAPGTEEEASRPATGANPLTSLFGRSPEQVSRRLKETKKQIGWQKIGLSARKWWEAFEQQNASNLHEVLHWAEELRTRKATIDEFFAAQLYANTSDPQAVLHYMDFQRRKKEWEQRDKDRNKTEE